jgi:hypothetical protein
MGWYVERRIIKHSEADITRKDFKIKRRFWNYMRGCDWDAHRILEVSKGGMWSLCLMGPKVREWYYHTPEGRVHWSEVTESEHK